MSVDFPGAICCGLCCRFAIWAAARVEKSNQATDASSGKSMSRWIACVFAAAACAIFVVPVGANSKCFNNDSCQMPAVMEAPQTSTATVEKPAVIDTVPSQIEWRPAPEPTRPQLTIEQVSHPALKPSAYPRAERAPGQPERHIAREAPRHSSVTNRPVEGINRRHSFEPPLAQPYPLPSARVDVAAPRLQYGDGGLKNAQQRQPPSYRVRPGFITCLFSTDDLRGLPCSP